jgi:hypothetical protein
MAEIMAIRKVVPQSMQQGRAALFCAAFGLLASIVNVYLQFMLNQFFLQGSPVFIRYFSDGYDDLYSYVLYFACGLASFCALLFFGSALYRCLSLNVVAAILTLCYGYSAHYWFAHWHFGFNHWEHIAMLVPNYIVATTIHPVCLSVMFWLTLLIAKITQKNTNAEVAQSRMFLWRDWLTLVLLASISLIVWFNLYGTLGIALHVKPAVQSLNERN